MIRRWTAVLTLATVATACTWPMAGQGASRRGWSRDDTTISPADAPTIRAGWSAGAAGSGEVVASGDVVVATGPTVRAFHTGTGAPRWTAAASTAAIRDASTFTAAGGATCSLRRLTTTTGAVESSTTFGGPAVTPGGSLCAVTGTLLDSDGVVVVPWYSASITSVAGCDNSWSVRTGVTAFDGTLAPVWDRTVADAGCGPTPADLFTRDRFGDVTRTTTRWVTTHGDALESLPIGCGGPCAPAWSVPVTDPLGPAISLSRTTVAIVDAGGTVRTLDETTGAPVWEGSLGAPASAPLAADNARVFAIAGSTLLAFRAGGCGTPTCSPNGTASIGFPVTQRASLAGDVLYVAGTSLAAFDTDACASGTCTPLVTKAIGSAASAPVSVVNGRVVVPTAAEVRTFVKA